MNLTSINMVEVVRLVGPYFLGWEAGWLAVAILTWSILQILNKRGK